MKILIIAIQRADKTVGGMSYRFMALWDYFQISQVENQIYLLCTKSLYDKIYPANNVIRKNVFIINDYKFYKPKAVFFWLRTLFIIFRYKINSIHIAGAANLLTPLYYFRKVFGFKIIISFASKSIEMASYSDPSAAKKWRRVLKRAHKVDVLNPSYELPAYGFDVKVSPCSFPYFLKLNQFVLEKSENIKNNIILFVGALSKTKNPILALEGFYLFCSKNPNSNYQFILVGKGPLENEVKRMIKRMNNSLGIDRIFLRTELKSYNIYKIMAQSKVFLSLQDYDNYPSQSLQEAMLFNNCIIATDEGDTVLMVKKEYGNFLLKQKSALAISDAIYHASLNYSFERFELNSKLILKEHTIDRFAKYFIDIHKG